MQLQVTQCTNCEGQEGNLTEKSSFVSGWQEVKERGTGHQPYAEAKHGENRNHTESGDEEPGKGLGQESNRKLLYEFIIKDYFHICTLEQP